MKFEKQNKYRAQVLLGFLGVLFSMCLQGQTIAMEFPFFAGKTYDFIIFQGSKQETVQQDTIPANGKFTLKIPKQYAPYKGMSRWLITGTAEGGGLDMALPGHDFAISCLSATPTNDNIEYIGFDAVNELNRLSAVQQGIISKFETMSKAAQLYGEKHKLYKYFNEEKKQQQQAYVAFQKGLKTNPNFNARFLPIVNLTQGIPHRLAEDYKEKAMLVNEYICQILNFKDLYVSGHWTGIIRSWVQLQTNVIDDQDQFVKDFKAISNRITDSKMFTDFVGKVTYYLTTYGKDAYVDAIAHTVLGSGKIDAYLGVMDVYLKAMTGMQAPNLVIPQPKKEGTAVINTKTLNSKYSLLVFYRSDCGFCDEAIREIITDYALLKEKEIRVIMISGDTDKVEHQAKIATFPWKDTYCDFEGTSGINFRNYAVNGTPTLFMLDDKGIIIEKFATAAQLLTWAKGR